MEIPVPAALRNLNFKSLRSQPRKKLPKAVLTADIATSLLPKKKLKQSLAADKFTVIEELAALVISTHQGSLSLNGLNSLSDASAEALSKHGDSLYLNGLTSLSEAAATSLARHHDKLYLNGIEHMPEAVANALSYHKGDLLLDGIKKLSDESALLLSKHQGWLHLDGLTDFPDTLGHIALAHNLAARHRGTLALNEIKTLPMAILKILVTHQGILELNGFESVTLEEAKVLSSRDLFTKLYGLKFLGEDLEAAFSKRHTKFWFDESRIERPFRVFPKYPRRTGSIFGIPDDFDESSITTESISNKTNPSLLDPSKPLETKPAEVEKRVDDDSWMDDEDETWITEENEVLNQVSGITDQEREMYRSFMGWNGEGALSFEKLGKRHSMTASAARTICDRVEHRMRASKFFKPEVFHQNPPAPDENFPRDGEPIRKTEDLLFLALMLEKCATTGWMESSRDATGRVTYRIIPRPAQSAVKGQQFWKTKTLKELIMGLGFWEVRRLRRRPDGHRIKIPRGLQLKFPVRRGADPLLSSNSWTEHFHSWSEAKDMVIKPGEIICPLCGSMPPLIVKVISPKETWAMSCGREYDFSCCSGCLGTFNNRVTRMN
jgi:hypothetical protein